MEKNNISQQINIELNEAVGEGVYANLSVISHSPSEFVLDFIRMMPGIPKAQVKSRIIMTPDHAKRLMMSLAENISQYETEFGEIKCHAVRPESEIAYPINTQGEA